MKSLTNFINKNPFLVDIVVGCLRVSPISLAFVRRRLFFSRKPQGFPLSLLPEEDRVLGHNTVCSERTIFVDVSATARFDHATGISRVTSQLLHHWAHNRPEGCKVVPVYGDGLEFYSFVKSEEDWNSPHGILNGVRHDAIRPRPNDILVLLDLGIYVIPEMNKCLERFRQRGTKIYVVLYDFIPMQYPQYMPGSLSRYFRSWLDVILGQATGVISISRAVANDLMNWLDKCPPLRKEALQIGFAHIGVTPQPARRLAGGG